MWHWYGSREAPPPLHVPIIQQLEEKSKRKKQKDVKESELEKNIYNVSILLRYMLSFSETKSIRKT